jgi:hypothetical protein
MDGWMEGRRPRKPKKDGLKDAWKEENINLVDEGECR